jgi:hypothetical protein
VASLPSVFPYGMPGYGTTLLSFQDVQQIEQAMDITTETAGERIKMPKRGVNWAFLKIKCKN